MSMLLYLYADIIYIAKIVFFVGDSIADNKHNRKLKPDFVIFIRYHYKAPFNTYIKS